MSADAEEAAVVDPGEVAPDDQDNVLVLILEDEGQRQQGSSVLLDHQNSTAPGRMIFRTARLFEKPQSQFFFHRFVARTSERFAKSLQAISCRAC